ncbi:hypothetical protein SYNPS1DRAFT_17322, partial [Syncephalis pseudoplumigaleata]
LSMCTVQYRAYCGSKARYMNEQFIEGFDLDLITLPDNLPSWFMHQRHMLVMHGRLGCSSARLMLMFIAVAQRRRRLLRGRDAANG